MPIDVVTGGPIGGENDLLTLGDMINDIADDIDDTNGEYTAAIRRAIIAAIRYCERNKYYFNETREITFDTVNGQEFYRDIDNQSSQTFSYIRDAVHISRLWSEDSSGQRNLLRRARPEEIELVSDNSASRGEPYAWDYFEQQIRLYPIPGERVFTIRMEMSIYRLGMPTSDTDTSAFITEAYDMLKERAKYNLAKDTLKDVALAQASLLAYEDQEMALSRETSNRGATGKIVVTCF